VKVRWTTRCAGGCGTWLIVGAQAERRHRSLWCPRCYTRHLSRCGRCQDTEDRAPVLAGVSGQPVLF
jgi:hypothetical protein